MVLVSSVTAPVSAMTLPHPSVAPVCMVTLVSAIIFPTNDVVVPRVAELPTCQNTLSVASGIDNRNTRAACGRERAPYLEDDVLIALVPPKSRVRAPVN